MTWTCLRRQPKQQRSRDRVETILDAAAKLLAEAGPDGTTITAVAASTGLATSSIYDYVEDDRNLIGAVAERGLDQIHQLLVELIGTPTAIDEIIASTRSGLRMFLALHQTEIGLRQAIAFVDADPVLMQLNLNDTRRNAALIEGALAQVQPEADFGAAILLMVHLSGSLAALTNQVNADEADLLIEHFEQLIATLLVR